MNILNQKLVTLGGQTGSRKLDSVSCYNPWTGVWKSLPEMNYARANFAATTFEQCYIIVAGGYLHNFRSTDSVEVFDWWNQTWYDLPRLPVRLGSCSIAVLGERDIYVAGGVCDSHTHNRASSVYRYAFGEQKWTTVKSMSVPRSDGHLIAYGKYLYAIGGHTAKVERYDPEVNEWTMMASMIPEVDESEFDYAWFGATLHHGKIYVCGEKGFAAYDPEADVWVPLPANPYLGRGTSLVSINGRLLAVGGYRVDDGVQEGSAYQFDFVAQKWTEFCRLDSAIANHRAVAVRGY